jgi:hypothetical protein
MRLDPQAKTLKKVLKNMPQTTGSVAIGCIIPGATLIHRISKDYTSLEHAISPDR